MDFVYPLGNGSLHKDFELGISMRSVRKFVGDAGRIFVLGAQPKTDPGVDYELVAADDDDCHKQHNTMQKMRLACKMLDKFIWMNDDFFFRLPVRCADIGLYHQGSLGSHIEYRANNPNNYYRALVETDMQLRARRLPTLDFEVHAPLPVTGGLMRSTLATFEWRDGVTPLMRSLYGNQHGLESQFCADCKISEPLLKSEIARRVCGNGVFSVGDGAFVRGGEMKEFLQELVA